MIKESNIDLDNSKLIIKNLIEEYKKRNPKALIFDVFFVISSISSIVLFCFYFDYNPTFGLKISASIFLALIIELYKLYYYAKSKRTAIAHYNSLLNNNTKLLSYQIEASVVYELEAYDINKYLFEVSQDKFIYLCDPLFSRAKDFPNNKFEILFYKEIDGEIKLLSKQVSGNKIKIKSYFSKKKTKQIVQEYNIYENDTMKIITEKISI